MNEDLVKNFWHKFVQENPQLADENTPYTSWAFGSNEEQARELLDLVKSGDKTATCSLYRMYEVEDAPLPTEGEFNVITDWSGNPEAVTRTTDLDIIPFLAVPEDFAEKEGEGDKSYEYWHDAHVEFFTEELKSINEEFEDDLPVVCEQFELLYKE
ncbi:ASCH domain-containing protein [Alkalibacillus haloalkaliphilus]|uniref:RNA-binding protein n=1 Tax=Alkalibacillus haloalkaliphilus TaxID=94136 RepID=A0A511VZZ2_9BACI|nr:ASCH domain-containing protein [Alkalibacillus haloalkaliphilus]GEN44399.1 RNA-binding protein [Alkalibacillus haloalkaliphilus]